MPRWMSDGRNKDSEENIEIQPILTELSLHQNKNNSSDTKKPKELQGEKKR